MAKWDGNQNLIDITTENSNVKVSVNNTEYFLPYSKVATKSTITPQNFRDELVSTIGTDDWSTLLGIEAPTFFEVNNLSTANVTIREKDGSSSNILQKLIALGTKYDLTLLPFTIYRSMHCSGRHQSPCLYTGTNYKRGADGTKKIHALTKKPFSKSVIGRQTSTGALLLAEQVMYDFSWQEWIQEYSNVSNWADFIQGYIKIAQGCAGSSKNYKSGWNASCQALPCIAFADLTTGKTKFIIMLASTSQTWHDNNYQDTVFRCWIKPILVQKILASKTTVDNNMVIRGTTIDHQDEVGEMQWNITFSLSNNSDQRIWLDDPIIRLYPENTSSAYLECFLSSSDTQPVSMQPHTTLEKTYNFTIFDTYGVNWSIVDAGFYVDMWIFLTPASRSNRYKLLLSSQEIGASSVLIENQDTPASVSDVSLSINNNAKLEMSGGWTYDMSQWYLHLNDIWYINKSSHDIKAKCTSVQLMENGSSYVDTDTSQLAANDKLLQGLSFTMYAKTTSPYSTRMYQRLGDLNFNGRPSQYITDECRVKYELWDTVTNTYITSITSSLLDVPYSYT